MDPVAADLALQRVDLLLRRVIVLVGANRLEEAEALTLRALEVEPDNAAALANLASIRERAGDHAGSRDLFARAVARAPRSTKLLSNHIFALDRRADVTLEEAYAARRRYNAVVARPVLEPTNDPDPDRTLRVGYVSADFKHHSAAYTFGPVLLKHDPALFEVFAYSGTLDGDDLTDLLSTGVPHFRHVAGTSDDELEAIIRADGIDILVDLSGHSAGNRLPVFARKPAPVQVTAWGYITGTGLDAMDYLFADDATIAPDEERFYAERIIRLPRLFCYWPGPDDEVGPIAPAPFLANGHLTFGCFQRLGKLTDDTFRLWARVLEAVPDARLFIKSPGLEQEGPRQRLAERFAAAGGDLDRLLSAGATTHTEHLRAHHLADVCLDPWPDGGGVSTLEAAWMGVPTLTAPWRQIASRLSSTVNRELGLDQLVAASPGEYVERAVWLDEQRDRLAEIRPLLRDLMRVSALADHELYTRAVERAYRTIWRDWCAERARPALRVVS